LKLLLLGQGAGYVAILYMAGFVNNVNFPTVVLVQQLQADDLSIFFGSSPDPML